MAERLTGWTQADALGRDVREVFQIVEEKTRAARPEPGSRRTGEGRILRPSPRTPS